MSKAQKDGFKTYTDVELNKHRDIFYKKLVDVIDEQTKEYKVNGGKIICTQKNVTEHIGFKINSIKVVGIKYFLYIYSDENSNIADAVETLTNKDEANKQFKFWKNQLEM